MFGAAENRLRWALSRELCRTVDAVPRNIKYYMKIMQMVSAAVSTRVS